MTVAPGREQSWRSLPLAQKRDLLIKLAERRRDLVRRRWPTPGALASELDPSTRNPAHLAMIDSALVDVAEGRCERLMIIMPPQEGKSERTSHYGALWMLLQDPERRIAIASYELETARRWGQVIRNDLITYDLPVRLREDSRAASRWAVDGHRGGVYAVGVGGALTGRPVDLLLIDDPVKDRIQADSATQRENVWSWWTDVARTRLAPNAPVILIMTRWHEDDLAGRILSRPGSEDWTILRIPAQAEDDDDPLGREPGEYLPSAREWPEGRWESVKRDIGSRSWNALYQGRPSAAEGEIWLRQWWRRYRDLGVQRRADGAMVVPAAQEVIQSWDLAFKDSKSSDFVVGQIWARIGPDAYLLDQIRQRLDFPATVRAIETMSERWPQTHRKLVEDKANGPAVISSLKSSLPGLVPVDPQGGKEARASAVSAFIESGNVWLPDLPWADEFIEEAAAFPNGAHDDMVDAASQALTQLYLAKRSRILV